MVHFRKILLTATWVCLVGTAPAWGQNAAVVYVATGGPEIYAVSASGTATALIPTTDSHYHPGAAFESLAVGPDNRDANTSQNSFFLYACDPTGNLIVRLQLDASSGDTAANAVDDVYGGADTPTAPVCGRVASNGDLYVSSAAQGEGVYVIHGASATMVGGVFDSPSLVYGSASALGSSFIGGGITQKNVGDMLVVDKAESRIWKAEFVGANPTLLSNAAPFAETLSDYISNSSGLSTPTGIARISTGEFFVVNHGSLENVGKFDPGDLSNPSVCVGTPSGNVALTSVATSEDNYLYVGVASPSQNKRVVEVYRGSDCSFQQAISLSAIDSPLGIAVPPVSAVPISATSTPPDGSGNIVNTYNFGSSVIQSTTSGCVPTSVTQSQEPLSYLQTLVNNAMPDEFFTGTWTTGKPIPYNGEGGFGTLYTVNVPSDCSPSSVQTNLLIGSLHDTTQFTNPRIIRCEAGTSQPTCYVTEASGTWPVGGYLSNDPSSGGRIPGFSKFFLANGTLSGELGSFCGFDSPLNSTADPALAPVFNSGQNLSVKFKLALGQPGDCSNGPYITDAMALLSVARVADGQGKAVFEPITISSSGKSASDPPTFKYKSSSQQYQFSLTLKGYESGLYSLTVTFLSNNAPYVTTYFKIQ